MTFIIEKDESNADRRTVPFRLFTSNGTSPDTNASDGTMLGSVNGAAQLSLGSISAISANAGLYKFALSQSNVSVLGSIALYTDTIATDFPQHVATVQVVNYNPMSSFSNIAAKSYSGVSFEASNIAPGNYSGVSVRIQAGDYGSHTSFGASTFKAGDYSGVTFGVNNIKGGNYSDVSVRIQAGDYGSHTSFGASTIKAGTYSGVTVGINNIAGGSYSDVTIQGISNYANISNVTLHAGTHSGASVGVRASGIAASSFQASSIDAAALATDAGQEIADRVLARTISGGADGGRDVTSALRALRNRVFMDSGSTGTVYQEDDASSAWTFSVSTVAAVAISQIDPGGV